MGRVIGSILYPKLFPDLKGVKRQISSRLTDVAMAWCALSKVVGQSKRQIWQFEFCGHDINLHLAVAWVTV